MPDHRTIYAAHAEEYEALIRPEDYQGNLLTAIRSIRALDVIDVVEMGAGTGRLTRLLAPIVGSIRAFDGAAAMLAVAADILNKMKLTNWQVAVADNRDIPAENSSADLAIEGWSFGYGPSWHGDAWRAEVGRMLDEMLRVLRPGGTAILIETLGTGRETPFIPTDGLGALYAWWQWERGFTGKWIRTDLRYDSVDAAEKSTRFFFGDEFADRIRREKLTIIPECTGIWWRTK